MAIEQITHEKRMRERRWPPVYQISESVGKCTPLLITYLDFSDCTIIVGYVHSMARTA